MKLELDGGDEKDIRVAGGSRERSGTPAIVGVFAEKERLKQMRLASSKKYQTNQNSMKLFCGYLYTLLWGSRPATILRISCKLSRRNRLKYSVVGNRDDSC